MANSKISALVALLGSAVDPAADVLPIVDTSVTTTKKILVSELFLSNASATFTATLTGCTTSPTVTASYSITNNVVTLFVPPLTATSNTTACTITGLPAAITPVTTHSQISITTTDNSASLLSSVDVTSGGVLTLRVGANSSATFTNSGTKGIAAGMTITYNLN